MRMHILSIIILINLNSMNAYANEKYFNCKGLSTDFSRLVNAEAEYYLINAKPTPGGEDYLVRSIEATLAKFCGIQSEAYKNYQKLILPKWRSNIEEEQKKLVEHIRSAQKYRIAYEDTSRLATIAKFLGKKDEDYFEKGEIDKIKKMAERKMLEREKLCTPVDLRQAPIDQPSDQDTVGWCYAFTAADLLSFKLKKKISPIDVALTFNKKTQRGFWNTGNIFAPDPNESKLESGRTYEAINYAISEGLCLEEDLPSSDFNFSKLAKSINGISNLKNRLEIVEKLTLNSNKEMLQCSGIEGALQGMFPRLNLATIKEILITTHESEIIQVLSKLNCKNRRIKIDELSIKEESVSEGKKGEELISVIHKQLDKKNIAGVSYYFFLQNRFGSNPTPHGSSVVGRRWNKNSASCELLIRNSHGDGCQNYNFEYRKRCEHGSIWVPEDHLEKNIFSAQYVE